MPIPRTDFDPQIYNQLIADKGYPITWSKFVLCPCILEASGQPDINCTLCNGTGNLWIDPTEIRGVISSIQNVTQEQVNFGTWQRGTAYCTVNGEYTVSHFDKIELLDPIVAFAEIVKRRTGTLVDRIRYKALEIEYLRTVDDVLSEGYSIDDNGNIEWDEEEAPEDGTVYTVRYTHHPIYIVQDIIHALRSSLVKRKYGTETSLTLPRQVLVKLDFMLDEKKTGWLE